MTRYRIVEHVNKADEQYYTIDIEHVWFFGVRFWRTLQSSSADGSCSVIRTFDTLEQAQEFLNSKEWQHRVVEQGELWTRNSYTL